jgi:aminoglycoside phosphotransferase (APT) family kinase protein
LPSLDPPFGIIPTTPDALTATWLATILTRHGFSAAIEAMEFRSLATSSLTSEIVRVVPRFQDETTGVTPALLWKRSSDDDRRRETFQGSYATEVAFYREIAPGVDVSVPRCFAAAHEQQTGAHVLLLEDLTPDTAGDFVRSVPPDHAEAVLREFARLHASRWTDPAPLRRPAGDCASMNSFVEQCVLLSTPYLTEHVDQHAAERTGRYANEVARLRSALAAGPQALIHGDAHPANVIFASSAAARPSLVDWQCSRVDAPLRDVAQFLMLALTVEDRRRYEQELLTGYLQDLQTNGAHYDAAAAAGDYRSALMLQWGWAVAFLRHEPIWDRDTGSAMPTLVKRAAAAFDDASAELDRA